MKIKKVMMDPEKNIISSMVIMQDKDKLFFEKHMDNPEKGKFLKESVCIDHDCYLGTWSHRQRLDVIELIQCSPEDLTIVFGDVGHIHLEGKEQIEGFVDSINWLYKESIKPFLDSDKKHKKTKKK